MTTREKIAQIKERMLIVIHTHGTQSSLLEKREKLDEAEQEIKKSLDNSLCQLEKQKRLPSDEVSSLEAKTHSLDLQLQNLRAERAAIDAHLDRMEEVEGVSLETLEEELFAQILTILPEKKPEVESLRYERLELRRSSDLMKELIHETETLEKLMQTAIQTQNLPRWRGFLQFAFGRHRTVIAGQYLEQAATKASALTKTLPQGVLPSPLLKAQLAPVLDSLSQLLPQIAQGCRHPQALKSIHALVVPLHEELKGTVHKLVQKTELLQELVAHHKKEFAAQVEALTSAQ